MKRSNSKKLEQLLTEQNLEQLLKMNYRGVPVSDECKQRVIQYIQGTPHFSNQEIGFIEKLMKVTKIILDSDSTSLDSLLERLFRLNSEGIEKSGDGNNEVSIWTKVGLYYCRGYISMALFKKTGDIKWGEKGYEDKRTCADLTAKVNKKYSAHAYSFTARDASSLFKATRNPLWGERQYENDKLSAEMTAESEPKHCAYSNGFAGDGAYELWKLIKEKDSRIEWAKRGIECYNVLLGYYDKNPNLPRDKLFYAIKRKVYELKRYLRIENCSATALTQKLEIYPQTFK